MFHEFVGRKKRAFPLQILMVGMASKYRAQENPLFHFPVMYFHIGIAFGFEFSRERFLLLFQNNYFTLSRCIIIAPKELSISPI